MAPLSNICKNIFLRAVLQRNGGFRYRPLSTSGKKDDVDKCGEASEPQEGIYRKVPDFSKPHENKNWVSYGFSHDDKATDRFELHITYFTLFSLLFCGSCFIFYYFPDRKGNDWARREAFIRLHEREQLGLEPIDPNYIDPAKIVLPPDEELSEEDIVI